MLMRPAAGLRMWRYKPYRSSCQPDGSQLRSGFQLCSDKSPGVTRTVQTVLGVIHASLGALSHKTL